MGVACYMGLMFLLFSLFFILISFSFFYTQVVYFIEWDIFTFGSSSIVITFLFDWMSLLFSGLVLFISSIVMFYRVVYMQNDKYFRRFIYLVYLFVLSMILMVLSPNIIRILLGWDGLGLVSYCLVIFYQSVKSTSAGLLTIFSNRIGDVAVLLRISWMLNFGSWNFFYIQIMYERDVLLVLILIILARLTKRAQIPFSAWLPAAMAAPTPVSALVHSSTLVTAGVYLLIRFNYYLGVNSFLFYVGCFTMFMSGLGANFENDLKKIIALSTLRQLGFMVLTLRIGFVEMAFFHLLTHAMFKSLLFLCAGVFIHSVGDVQDVRMIRGLDKSCPLTSFYFIGASLALCGFPFISGFYSKDVILDMYLIGFINIFMLFFMVLSTILTLTYSIRLVFRVYFKNYSGNFLIYVREDFGMVLPMTGLMLLTVFAGGWLRINIFPLLFVFMPGFLKIIVFFLLALFGGAYFCYLAQKKVVRAQYIGLTGHFVGSMWFLPFISSSSFMQTIKIGRSVLKTFDHGWLELISGQGLVNYLYKQRNKLDYLNVVNLKIYLFMFFIVTVLVTISIYLNSLT